jgi:hypothetical protein
MFIFFRYYTQSTTTDRGGSFEQGREICGTMGPPIANRNITKIGSF